MASKKQAYEDLIDFFIAEGKVFTRSEYRSYPQDKTPFNYRAMSRIFAGRQYNAVVKQARITFPDKWAQIGKTPEPVKKAAKKPAVKKAAPKDASPVEQMRDNDE